MKQLTILFALKDIASRQKERRIVEVTSFEVSSKARPKGYRSAYDDRRRI